MQLEEWGGVHSIRTLHECCAICVPGRMIHFDCSTVFMADRCPLRVHLHTVSGVLEVSSAEQRCP